jgi:parallel beta-helix repeat protein
MAGSLTKGYIGKEDLSIQINTNATETFERLNSVGGTVELKKFPDIWDGIGKINIAKLEFADKNYTPDYFYLARNYASINAAVTAIGSTQTTLVVTEAETLADNLIIPSTLNLLILKGGSIVKASTYTLTINGQFEAGLYQVFEDFDAGDITFDLIKEVYPEWWAENTTPGTTDMTDEINTCVATGKECVLTDSVYLVSSPINLVSNAVISGKGIGNTIIRQKANANTNVIYGLEKTDFVIRDLSIDGNKDNNPTGDNGISLYDCTRFIIERVESYNNKLKGFVLADACTDGIFLNVEAHNNSQDGITFASGTSSGKLCERNSIVNSNLHDNTIYGIGLVTPDTNYLQTQNILIQGNTIKDNGSYGIEVFGAEGPRIIGNHIEGSGNHGIDLGSISNSAYMVTNAVITGNIVKNGATTGIQLQSVYNSIIIGNRCYDDQVAKTQTYGIVQNNEASDNIIAYNDVTGNLTAGISTASGANVIGNTGYNPVDTTAITAGASPYIYTAGSSPETLYILGGTVSNIRDTISTVTLATATSDTLPVTIDLAPNQSITITHTVAPYIRISKH